MHKLTDSGDSQTGTELLSDGWFMALKIIILSIVTAISVILNILTIVNGTDDESVDGVDDKVHDWTTPINQYFGEDLSRRDALLIVNGFLIDLLIIVQGVRLLFRGTTFRFFIANMIFYGVRYII